MAGLSSLTRETAGLPPDGTALERIFDALALEQRPNQPYDEQDAGHLIMPNGSMLDSFDRAFLGVCAPLVLELYR